jgi:PiT family inorganic phosphate transporter
MSETIVITVIIISFALSFAIGANDAANALGTSYGSNAAHLWVLLILGAIFEFVGSVWCSSRLAGKLCTKFIPGLSVLSPDI